MSALAMFGHASPQNSRVTEYCPEPTCDDPDNPGFPRPVDRLGYCATHRRQKQRTGKVSAITEKVSAKERLINLGDAWLSEEDDEREKVLYRRFIAAAKGMEDDPTDAAAIVAKYEGDMRQRRAAAALKGFENARKAGKRIGRPLTPVMLDEVLARAYAETGSISATARVVGLDRATVRTLLGKAGGKARVTTTSHLEAAGPRKAG